jgi:hypothetical protein
VTGGSQNAQTGDGNPQSSSTSSTSSVTSIVIAGIVAFAANILIMVGLGFYCLRKRLSNKDIDDFVDAEENDAAAASRHAMPVSASVPSPVNAPASTSTNDAPLSCVNTAYEF